MILHIPNLLSLDELNHCRQTLSQAEWTDGKVTTGYQSAHLKNNLQLGSRFSTSIRTWTNHSKCCQRKSFVL